MNVDESRKRMSDEESGEEKAAKTQKTAEKEALEKEKAKRRAEVGQITAVLLMLPPRPTKFTRRPILKWQVEEMDREIAANRKRQEEQQAEKKVEELAKTNGNMPAPTEKKTEPDSA